VKFIFYLQKDNFQRPKVIKINQTFEYNWINCLNQKIGEVKTFMNNF